MSAAVRYFSKTGNTKKLADSIAEAVGVSAETVDVPLTEPVDVLFLGSSVYYAGADKKVKDFLKNLNGKAGKVVIFSTAAIIESTHAQLKEYGASVGANVVDEEYHCRGVWAKRVHKGHPNAAEIKEAADFAKSVIA